MQKRAFLALAVMLIAAGSITADSLASMPPASVITIRLDRLSGDGGVSWLVETWHATPRDESRLRNVLLPGMFTDMSLAVLSNSNSTELPLLMIATIAPGQTPSADGLRSIIADDASAIQTASGGGSTIYYNAEPREEQEFAAYVISGGLLILGVDRAAVEYALGSARLTSTATFQAVASQIDLSDDGMLLANNDGGQFADFLAPLEQKWQMSLLLSAPDLEWMASSFDVVDSQRVVGRILFKGDGPGAMADIVDDAEFLGETFRRKFIGENIAYSSDVTRDGLLVSLDFEVEGLESLWLRLFENGVFSILHP
jgi:hypothetical protein